MALTQASLVSVIIDADNYFQHTRSAMLQAKKRIMLIGWDFDARVEFGYSDGKGDGPRKIGDFIYWLVKRNPDLEVYLLRWDTGAIKSVFRGDTIFTLAKWMRHPRIHTKLDNAHPFGSSHHQKIILIDDIMAFCGGIDVTGMRWDTRAHKDDDPKRKFPGKKPYPAWHDASCALTGPVVNTITDFCLKRWRYADGKKITRIKNADPIWPVDLNIDFENVDIIVEQTLPKIPGRVEYFGIEELYLAQIAAAKKSIYVESQYFCSRRIAEAIAKRLTEKNGPEIVVINPKTAQGWLEPIAMDSAREQIIQALQKADKSDRFRLYHPVTRKGAPIYVHAKIMIIDDKILRIGSSNLNNRSMRLDSECDVAILAKGKHTGQVTHIRNDLLAEHLGVGIKDIDDCMNANSSIIVCIENLRGKGKTLVPYVSPNLSVTEKWIAENEVLDPNGPDEMFESFAKRGLFRGRLAKFAPRWHRKS
jgi:phosphatidylserine/phosphatidylglycerophosphate/cardiolipin synthase-like enzyme